MAAKDRERSPHQEDLAAILSAEERLAKVIADAEAEAQGIISAAETTLHNMEQNEAADLASALAEVQSRELAYRQAELANLEQAGALSLGRFRTIPDQRIAQLSDLVIDRLLGSGGKGAA